MVSHWSPLGRKPSPCEASSTATLGHWLSLVFQGCLLVIERRRNTVSPLSNLSVFRMRGIVVDSKALAFLSLFCIVCDGFSSTDSRGRTELCDVSDACLSFYFYLCFLHKKLFMLYTEERYNKQRCKSTTSTKVADFCRLIFVS